MKNLQILSAVLLVVAPLCGAHGLDTPIVFTQIPTGSAAPKGTGTPPCVDGARLAVLRPDGSLKVLTPDFAAACDPEVSFDGGRILFAGKRSAHESFDIFEMDLACISHQSPAATGDLTTNTVEKCGLTARSTRRLTANMGDCREPIYLPRASVSAPNFDDPVRWLAFTSTAHGGLNELGTGLLTSLYVMNLEPIKGRDTVVWRTTYGLGGDFSPTLLPDGRVVFSSHHGGRVKLMTVTWAGDNLNLFRPAADGIVPAMAVSWPQERSLLVVERDVGERGGRLAAISLRRPLHLLEVLSSGSDLYLFPEILRDGRILASQTRNGSSALVFFDRDTGRAGPLVFDDPDFDDVDVKALTARPEPLARIPMLEFASVLDIEGFENAGQLHCMSVYDSEIPEIAALRPGSVRWARFIRGVPKAMSEQDDCRADEGAAWPPPCTDLRILGEAPVEEDGSFFVNITGNMPFFIELLDEDKKVLHAMESWIWIRSKSQRGCIGCHEDRELAPQNRATEALLKMQPTFLTSEISPKAEASEHEMVSSHEPGQEGEFR